MIKKLVVAICFSVVFGACTYDTFEKDGANSGVVIQTGTVCGWCAQNDTLKISGNSLRYVNYTDCSTTNASIQKYGQISQTEFDDLVNLLDFNALKQIDLNACNVCVDGCDTWLLVNNGTESHYIRFGGTEGELQPIQAFLNKLNQIKSGYSGED